MLIEFEKLHGTGNDFILINNLENNINLSSEEIQFLCHRHFGIGADGLILVEKSDNGYFMNYYNADGHPAEMCGNGMRCTAYYIFNHFSQTNNFKVNSRIGLIPVQIDNDYITVQLPKADFNLDSIHINSNYNIKEIQDILNDFNIDIEYPPGLVSMGNPHCVIVVNDLDEIPVKELGPIIENHPLFLNKINVNFVQPISDEEFKIITWERGDGLTLACGTGTCASASYLNQLGLINESNKAYLPGGELDLELKDKVIKLSGPAKSVFRGTIEV